MLLNLIHRHSVKKMTDSELINQYQLNGSVLIIGEIYKRYGRMLFGVNLKYLRNKADAEDLLMQTFEKLPNKLKKSDIKNLKNWIYTVSKNECLMFLRQNKPKADIDSALLTVASDDDFKLAEIIEKEAELNTLESAILELKNEQQQCINLFYIKQYSYDLVANETGFELKKVKSYIQNGKRNLKLILERKDVIK